jgi:hypothetical protein
VTPPQCSPDAARAGRPPACLPQSSRQSSLARPRRRRPGPVPSCRCGHERHTGRPCTSTSPMQLPTPVSRTRPGPDDDWDVAGERMRAKFTSEPRKRAYLQRREGKRAARRRRRTHAGRPGMPPPPGGEPLFAPSASALRVGGHVTNVHNSFTLNNGFRDPPGPLHKLRIWPSA